MSFGDLAERLEVTVPTIRNALKRWADAGRPLPIHTDRNGTRFFMRAEVDLYLIDHGIGPRLAGDNTKTRLDNAGQVGSASDRRVLLAGDKLELEIERIRGNLVDRDELTAVFSQEFAKFGKMLDNLPTKIVRQLDIPVEMQAKITEKMRLAFDEARLAIVQGNEQYFGLVQS